MRVYSIYGKSMHPACERMITMWELLLCCKLSATTSVSMHWVGTSVNDLRVARRRGTHSVSALIAMRALSKAGRIITVRLVSGAGIMSSSVDAADDSVKL